VTKLEMVSGVIVRRTPRKLQKFFCQNRITGSILNSLILLIISLEKDGVFQKS